MQESQPSSSPVKRIVTVFGIVALLGMIGFFILVLFTPVKWTEESFHFASGPRCVVFPEPKLALFLGDGGSDEVFDRIHGIFHDRIGFTVNHYIGFFSSSDSDFSLKTQGGKTTMQFYGGKGSLVVTQRGTKLMLADGREFTLDGQTPLWLRCKSDGTIEQLDELPEGFVGYFESPPPDPGMIRSIESYPKAFQK